MSDTPVVKPNTINSRPNVGTQPEVISILATGVTVASGAGSANVAIPKCSNGDGPNRIRIVASVAAYVKVGAGAGLTAAAGDMMVQPGDSLVVDAMGSDHVAAIQVAAAGVVQVSPVEN